jgi:hypothetical protein
MEMLDYTAAEENNILHINPNLYTPIYVVNAYETTI